LSRNLIYNFSFFCLDGFGSLTCPIQNYLTYCLSCFINTTFESCSNCGLRFEMDLRSGNE
jgi:transcription elongation factor Elf1